MYRIRRRLWFGLWLWLRQPLWLPHLRRETIVGEGPNLSRVLISLGGSTTLAKARYDRVALTIAGWRLPDMLGCRLRLRGSALGGWEFVRCHAIFNRR
jgi:hypothetical protein